MRFIFLSIILLSQIMLAQTNIYPLNTFYKDVPNYSYLKDDTGILKSFIGKYKAEYLDRVTTISITLEKKKLIDYGSYKFYRDTLVIEYSIKRVGSKDVLQSNIPIDTQANQIVSLRVDPQNEDTIIFNYSGSNCGVGWGKVKLKKLARNRISWSFFPSSTLLSSGDCTEEENNVYLPVTDDLLFTKI